MNIKGIIFDMDGVILDSNAPKKNAFSKIFPEYDDIVNPIVKKLNKQNREVVITHILYAIKEAHPQVELEEPQFYFQRFIDLTQEVIKQVPYIPGAKNAIRMLHADFKLAINTMSPDVYAIDVLKHFGIDKYMTHMLGGTSGSKEENILAICKAWNCTKDDIVFVGDGDTDLTCARNLNLVFVGIQNCDNDFETQNITYLLHDLETFMNLIRELQDTSEPDRMTLLDQ